jgi:autotransporter translocation and assembly factor TamB
MLRFFNRAEKRPKPQRRSRWKRRIALTGLALILLTAAASTALYLYLGSDRFREQARQYVEENLARQTGAEVSLGKFEWDLREQRFHLEDVILRGSEPRDGPPLAHIDRIDAGVRLRDLLDRKANFTELIIERPQILLLVDADGKTNIPAFASRAPDLKLDYQVSIDDFKIVGGAATINARPVAIDFAITRLNSAMTYRGNTGVLSGQLRYEGTAQGEGATTIPYSFGANFDYTAGAVLAHGIEVKSDTSAIKAQGRIDHVLTPELTGQLEYTGKADTRFLKHFFAEERIGGNADIAGRLEFSRESFSVNGTAAAERASLEDWTATNVKARYAYRFPGGQLMVTELRADTAGGTVEGNLTVANTPPSRITLDLRYRNIDSVELERLYPWDPKFRIYSRLDGTMSGWFEGRFSQYLLTGNTNLTAYPPKAIPDTIALPFDGTSGYTLQPGGITIRNGQGRFFATTVEGDGVIEPSAWKMKVKMASSDLRNLFFLYPDANGTGSFEGELHGPLHTPTATGTFEIAGHTYQNWLIERAQGAVRLDTEAEVADLTNVRLTEGTSSATISGRVTLDGASADLRLESARIDAKDAGKFDRRISDRLEGTFAGKAHLTSLAPLRADGDVEAHDLVIDKRPIGTARAHVRYDEPVAEFTGLNVTRGSSTVKGTATVNSQSNEMTFDVDVRSIDVETVRDLGVPAAITGTVDGGHFTGSGTVDRLSFAGKDISFRESHGAVVTGELAYTAGSDALTFNLNVKSLTLDLLRNIGRDIHIPASLAEGTVIEQGSFTASGDIRNIAITGKKVSLRDRSGATLEGELSYNTATDAITFEVDLSSLKLALVQNVAGELDQDLGIPASLVDGAVLATGHFSATGTAKKPAVIGKNVTIHDGHGATLKGDFAYNAAADTLTFEMSATSLKVGVIRDLRPSLQIPADVVDGAVIEQGQFSGSGSLSKPVITGKNVRIKERHGAVLTGQLGYDTGADKVSFDMSVAALALDSIRDLGVPPSLTGTIERATFSGDVTRKQPTVEGKATLRNLSFFGEQFPVANVTVPRSTGYKVPLQLEAGTLLSLNVQLDLGTDGYPFAGSGSFNQYSVEKLAGLRDETLRLTGRADSLEGSLTDPTRLRGKGRIESAEMLVQGRQLKSTGPFLFEFTHDKATFSGMSLTGTEGTKLNVGGTISLTEKERIDLTVNGTVNLDLLTAGSEWQAMGDLDIDGRVGGTIRDRDLFGRATLRNATIVPKGLLGSITSVNGQLSFEGNNVRLEDITGNIGGGKVQIAGDAILTPDQIGIESMNVRIGAENVRVTYAEGLRPVTDGALVLRGTWQNPLLEGNLQIRSMSYQSQFEKFLALLQSPGGLGNSSSTMSRLNLSIHVEGNRNISIKNELTETQAQISLDLRGTVGSPSITGHIEARGGTLLFQGRQYEITRGNIDFVNPFVIEPVVDVQAEADLRNYRVILAITGRGEKLRIEMRSDPALPDLEVFSLIAGGKTREEMIASSAQQGAVKSSEELFPGAAAAVLVDLLRSRVGETLGLPGLDRFRIDPLPLGTEKSALARITVPIQVSKDLSITYSQDLSSNAQQIIQIEYFISKDLSIIATRDENGSLGLDVKRRQRF